MPGNPSTAPFCPPGLDASVAGTRLTQARGGPPLSGGWLGECASGFASWPGDAEVAVALTFDVDGEAPWLGEGPDNDRRLAPLSQGRFGPARGLQRILDLLAELAIRAT